MKMTSAFIRNITDDYLAGLSCDIIKHFALDDLDALFNNTDALITYTREILSMYEGILIDSVDPIMHYPKIKCYTAFLKNNQSLDK